MPDTSDAEWEKLLLENYARNKAYARKEPTYQTKLNPGSELKFRQWLKANSVRFNPEAKITDYDMRGFWQALQTRNPLAVSAVDPNDKQVHYPDYWKTPYDATFSKESQWAAPGAPAWNDKDQLVLPNGKVLFDDRNRKGSKGG